MDEMKMVNGLTRNMISKFATKTLRKKTGYDVDVQLNELNVSFSGGKAYAHMNVDAEFDKDEFMKLIKTIGFGLE